jgi:hypothetical protein
MLMVFEVVCIAGLWRCLWMSGMRKCVAGLAVQCYQSCCVPEMLFCSLCSCCSFRRVGVQHGWVQVQAGDAFTQRSCLFLMWSLWIVCAGCTQDSSLGLQSAANAGALLFWYLWALHCLASGSAAWLARNVKATGVVHCEWLYCRSAHGDCQDL